MTRLAAIMILAGCAHLSPPPAYSDGAGVLRCAEVAGFAGDRAALYRATGTALAVVGALCGGAGTAGATQVSSDGDKALLATGAVVCAVAAIATKVGVDAYQDRAASAADALARDARDVLRMAGRSVDDRSAFDLCNGAVVEYEGGETTNQERP